MITALLLIAVVGAALSQGWLLWNHRVRELIVFGALVLAVSVLGVASQQENIWNAWMREDAWVEWSTVTAFLAATGVFAWRARHGFGLGRFTCAGLALFCFFVAGEELSWGQRIFTFEPPEIFLEANYQQEANLHNLLNDKEIAGFSLDSRFLIALIAVVYGVIAGTIGGLLRWRFSDRAWARDVAPTAVLAPSFALIAAVELDYPFHLTGEAAEWVLGLTFLADALLRGPVVGPKASRAVPMAALGLLPLSVALGLVSAPVLEIAVYGSDDERVAQANAELDQIAADMPAAMLGKLQRKGRVHKRLYTAVTSEYLAFGTDSSFLEGQLNPAEGEGRNDRKGYFLDPWNNPYWLLWDKRTKSAVVYSFGPNRRRDIETKPYKKPSEDDVVREIAAP